MAMFSFIQEISAVDNRHMNEELSRKQQTLEIIKKKTQIKTKSPTSGLLNLEMSVKSSCLDQLITVYRVFLCGVKRLFS